MLRSAVDWAFPCMNIYGSEMSGPAVHIDQGSCYAINLSDALIWSGRSGASPGHAGVQIDGAPGYGGDINLSGTYFVSGDSSVYVATGSPTINANGMVDHTTNGPVAAAGLPDIYSQLVGLTGPWFAATLRGGWTGNAHYRIDGLSRVELRGRITGPSGVAAFALPKGYYATASPPALMALMGQGVGSIAINNGNGNVTPTQASGDTAKGVGLDGISFPTT